MTSREPVIGIDLGTTNSLAAYVDSTGRPRVARDSKGRGLVPSVVTVDEGGGALVGQAARERRVLEPGRTIFSVKRLMGKALEDLGPEVALFPYRLVSGPERGMVAVEIDGRAYTPQELSALILREVRDRASAALGQAVRRAVITVPAYFDDAQRQATRDAARIAGLDVIRILNEPTAAALAYGLHTRREGTIVVYDLGGGTFDVSVLTISEGTFQVRATAGNTRLGGDDFDGRLMQTMVRDLEPKLGKAVLAEPAMLQQLRKTAEEVKIALTDEARACARILLGGTREYTRDIAREEFDSLIGGFVDETLACARRALADAGLTSQKVDEVVLVGGSSRVPLVRKRVEEFFGRKPLTELNPEEVVALGAAIQAHILAGGTREYLLLDVTPLSLGIETHGGSVSKLILRNSPIPCKVTEQFSTYVDGQTAVDIHILQGERELVKDCRSLGRFKLRGLPPMPATVPRIAVTFQLDTDGILGVTAVEQRSGARAAIEVVPAHGLTQEEVDQLVEDSILHAEEDFARHRFIDLRNQAEITLRSTERALVTARAGLSEEELTQITGTADRLRQALQTEDPVALDHALADANEATHRLAELVLATVVQRAADSRSGQEQP